MRVPDTGTAARARSTHTWRTSCRRAMARELGFRVTDDEHLGARVDGVLDQVHVAAVQRRELADHEAARIALAYRPGHRFIHRALPSCRTCTAASCRPHREPPRR